ncbi:MAG: M23 family peptidase, partial [Dolichospermum sp.]
MSTRVKILLNIITVIPMALGLPAKALEVQIMPKNPQLGDTVSVLIKTDSEKSNSNPTVKIGEKTYAAFEIAPRQYRSFMPT